MATVRPCGEHDNAAMLEIVNAAAEAYRDVIPADRWHQPYMPPDELEAEIAAGVRFWGHEDEAGRGLAGVIGIQPVRDGELIRHAYVWPDRRGRDRWRTARARDGLGHAAVLVGTWAAAKWAIRFYRRHGFELMPREDTAALLTSYWTIPERQIATSVVLSRRS